MKALEEADTQVLGVSIDAGPSQGAYAGSIGLNFPLLSDWPDYSAAKAFGVWREDKKFPHRVTFVIDKAGVIRGVIENERDMEIHSREALRMAKELAGS